MKNKWKSNRGLKAAMVIVSLLMAALTVCSAAAVGMCGAMGVYEYSKEEALKEYYDQYSNIYSIMALAWRMDDEQLEEITKTNFRFGIIKADDLNTVDISDPASYEVCNFETMPQKDAVAEDEARANHFLTGPNTMLRWDCSLFGYAYTYETEEDFAYAAETYDEPITGYYYNVSDGIFYYETEDAYYRVDTVGLPVGINEELVSFVYDSGQGTYYNLNREMCVVNDYYLTFDKFDEQSCSWETWDCINLDDRSFQHTDIRFAEDELTKETGEFNGKPIANHFYQTNGDGILTIRLDQDGAKDKTERNKMDSYWVVSQVREPLAETGIRGNYLNGDLFEQITFVLDKAYTWRYLALAFLVISAILWAVTTVLVLVMAGHKGYYEEICAESGKDGFKENDQNLQTESAGAEILQAGETGAESFAAKNSPAKTQKRWVDAIKPGFWQKIPLDVETCIILVPWMLLAMLGIKMAGRFSNMAHLTAVVLALAGLYLLAYIWLADFVIRVKVGKWWRNMLLYKFFVWIFKKVKKAFRFLLGILQLFRENISLLWKAILIIGGFCLLEFLGILVTGYAPEAELIIWMFYRAITAAVILIGIVQANKLKEGAKRLAEGNLSEKVKTEKMFWEFKKHGETLNRVGDGISLAVEKRMQSEHFRTELITNVSHDIKTPLTSIINYVDLLQKEDIDNEKVKEYLEVVDRQSARLKKLTEDLIEASKASTGSMPVNMEKLELGVFLTQTVGEFEEKFEAAGLKTVLHKPETEVFVTADGRHLWRVVENLVQNICKYAQPETRVYIDLHESGNEAVICFKNISRYELNISGDALMERFVRGDASRHTDGSGLGLSIAGSLMELMGGKLEIIVDGDLFKVILHFPR